MEHLYCDKDGRASVKAGGEKDQGYGVPVVSSGNQIFAEQTYDENRHQRQPWSELYSWKHGRDGRNDDHNHERRDVALRFLIALGEKRDSEQRGGKHHRQRQGH